MASVFEDWTVLPHKPIEKYADNLWSVSGMMPNGTTQRRMVLVRMQDGRVLVHNAIALEAPLMDEILAWGRPEIIVVPNAFHRQDAKIFKARFPAAKVIAPSGARKKVEAVVPVDGTFDDLPEDETVRGAHLAGTRGSEGFLEVRSRDGVSLVFNDALLNMKRVPGPMGLLLAPTGRTSVPRVFRWMMVKDKSAFRSQLQQLAATEGLQRLLVGHGATVTENAAKALADAAELV